VRSYPSSGTFLLAISYSVPDNLNRMDLDPPRLRLLELIGDRETDLATVSREIGKNHAYLQQYIKRGTPRELPEGAREALAKFFRVEPDEFRANTAKRDLKAVKSAGGDLMMIGGQEFALLPVFDLRLSAGPGAWFDEEDSEPLYWEPYRHQWLRSISSAAPSELIIARVEGDSMESTLHNGDQVLIDRTRRRVNRDGIYGIRRDDDLQVKRIAVDPRNGLLTIISDNPQYPRWEGVNPDSVAVIGRVIWLGRQV